MKNTKIENEKEYPEILKALDDSFQSLIKATLLAGINNPEISSTFEMEGLSGKYKLSFERIDLD